MPSRRAALYGLAAGLVTAGSGCAGVVSSGPGTSGRSATTTSGRTSTSTNHPTPAVETLAVGETAAGPDGTTVTVASFRLRKIVYTLDVGSSAHAYPAGDATSQFLVADVSTSSGDGVGSLPLAVTIDADEATDRAYRLGGPGDVHGPLAFPIPVSPADQVWVEWGASERDRFRWPAPDSVVTDGGRSPAFEVRRFDVPESVERNADFRATLEVANGGDRPGRFLGAVYDLGAGSLPLVTKFVFDVPVGESVTEELEGREVGGDRSRATAILDWGVDQREASFELD